MGINESMCDFRKGLAVHTMVLIIMIGMFTAVSLFLFYKWASPSIKNATKASCVVKQISYCTDWSVNDFNQIPWEWDEKNPKDCHNVGISEPTVEDCNKILG